MIIEHPTSYFSLAVIGIKICVQRSDSPSPLFLSLFLSRLLLWRGCFRNFPLDFRWSSSFVPQAFVPRAHEPSKESAAPLSYFYRFLHFLWPSS
jgi:hypothetical protein